MMLVNDSSSQWKKLFAGGRHCLKVDDTVRHSEIHVTNTKYLD
jgi:hypothetical protein